MYVLAAYDVSTATPGGARRLRKIAKKCVAHGQRVQNSVFECSIDPGMYEQLKADLVAIMDQEKDSLRFYNLGKSWKNKVEHYGADEPYDPDESMIV